MMRVSDRKAAVDMSDEELEAASKAIDRRIDRLRLALDDSGGCAGSPGEWLYERAAEIEFEQLRRSQHA